MVDGWSVPNGIDSEGIGPFARRRYLLAREDKRSFLDTRLQSGKTAWGNFLTTLTLSSYHSGSEPPFLKSLVGLPTIKTIPFDSRDGLLAFLSRAIGACTNDKPFGCKIDLENVTFMLDRIYSPEDATIAIWFKLLPRDPSASAQGFQFQPAVQKLIMPLLSALGLAQQDIESCVTFTPTDSTEKLYADQAVSCASFNGGSGRLGLRYKMTANLRMGELGSKKVTTDLCFR